MGPCDKISLSPKLIFCFTKNTAALRDKISKVVTLLATSWSCGVASAPTRIHIAFLFRGVRQSNMTSTTRLTRLYDIFLSPWICFASRSHAGLGTQSIGLSEPDKLTGSGTCPDTPRYSYTTPLYLRKLPIRPGTAVEIHLSHSTPANFQASAKTGRKKNFLPFRGYRRFSCCRKVHD